jgi:hypothetical protein
MQEEEPISRTAPLSRQLAVLLDGRQIGCDVQHMRSPGPHRPGVKAKGKSAAGTSFGIRLQNPSVMDRERLRSNAVCLPPRFPFPHRQSAPARAADTPVDAPSKACFPLASWGSIGIVQSGAMNTAGTCLRRRCSAKVEPSARATGNRAVPTGPGSRPVAGPREDRSGDRQFKYPRQASFGPAPSRWSASPGVMSHVR